jgi:hypothetical protein
VGRWTGCTEDEVKHVDTQGTCTNRATFKSHLAIKTVLNVFTYLLSNFRTEKKNSHFPRRVAEQHKTRSAWDAHKSVGETALGGTVRRWTGTTDPSECNAAGRQAGRKQSGWPHDLLWLRPMCSDSPTWRGARGGCHVTTQLTAHNMAQGRPTCRHKTSTLLNLWCFWLLHRLCLIHRVLNKKQVLTTWLHVSSGKT